MKTVSPRWGWLTLSLGALLVILTWFLHAYALLCWAWVVCSLSVAWIALTACEIKTYRNGFPRLTVSALTQWLFVGASMLNAAAGVANGLVMTANGMRMPVEPVHDWDLTPSFLDSPSAQNSPFCRMLVKADDAITPVSDTTVHYDVPRPHIVRGPIPSSEETPRFAALDDRHGIRICGETTVYSKGDMMGFIGSVILGIPGLALLILGFLWRKICWKRSAPTVR